MAIVFKPLFSSLLLVHPIKDVSGGKMRGQ